MEAAIVILASFSDQEVGMGVKIDFLPEGLDAGPYPREKLSVGDCLEVQQEGSHRCMTEFAQKPFVFKEYAQHL